MKGLNAFAYWDRSGLDSFIPRMLDDFTNEYNANWIEFAPYWWMENRTSSEVHPLGAWEPGATGYTIEDSDLVELINLFHSKGLKVFLRPTLEFHHKPGTYI